MWTVVRFIAAEALAAAAGSRWATRRIRRKHQACRDESTPAPGPGRELGATLWDVFLAAMASTGQLVRFVVIAAVVSGMSVLLGCLLHR